MNLYPIISKLLLYPPPPPRQELLHLGFRKKKYKHLLRLHLVCKPLIYVLNIDPQVHEFIFYYFQTPIVPPPPPPPPPTHTHTHTHTPKLKKPTAGSAQFACKYQIILLVENYKKDWHPYLFRMTSVNKGFVSFAIQ